MDRDELLHCHNKFCLDTVTFFFSALNRIADAIQSNGDEQETKACLAWPLHLAQSPTDKETEGVTGLLPGYDIRRRGH
jgi:hypothetical protein